MLDISPDYTHSLSSLPWLPSSIISGAIKSWVWPRPLLHTHVLLGTWLLAHFPSRRPWWVTVDEWLPPDHTHTHTLTHTSLIELVFSHLYAEPCYCRLLQLLNVWFIRGEIRDCMASSGCAVWYGKRNEHCLGTDTACPCRSTDGQWWMQDVAKGRKTMGKSHWTAWSFVKPLKYREKNWYRSMRCLSSVTVLKWHWVFYGWRIKNCFSVNWATTAQKQASVFVSPLSSAERLSGIGLM